MEEWHFLLLLCIFLAIVFILAILWKMAKTLVDMDKMCNWDCEFYPNEEAPGSSLPSAPPGFPPMGDPPPRYDMSEPGPIKQPEASPPDPPPPYEEIAAACKTGPEPSSKS